MELENLLSQCSGYSSDTRTLKAGQAFIALKGDRADGHEHLEEAARRGARCLIVAKSWWQAQATKPGTLPFYVADDTELAHWQCLRHFRKRLKGPLIAVAGSNGKTSTTRCLAHLFSSKKSLILTQGSQNGWQGIPKTFEQFREDSELAILEVGIDEPGFMQRYAEALQPDITLITSIGEEHLAHFPGGLPQIFYEETLLLHSTLQKGGKAYVPEDDDWLKQLTDQPGLQRVGAAAVKRWPFSHPYSHQRINCALACELAFEVGLPEALIRSQLQSYTLPEGRGRLLALAPDRWLIEDYYNANPSSLSASLSSASDWARSQGLPLHALLGDMLDLGDFSLQAHTKLLPLLREKVQGELVLVGKQWQEALSQEPSFPCLLLKEQHELAESFWQKPGVFLVKGSRGMKMERFLKAR